MGIVLEINGHGVRKSWLWCQRVMVMVSQLSSGEGDAAQFMTADEK
jgi:hypothetical protein